MSGQDWTHIGKKETDRRRFLTWMSSIHAQSWYKTHTRKISEVGSNENINIHACLESVVNKYKKETGIKES